MWLPVSIHVYLVVIPDVGDDVVDVSCFGLLEHPLHQLLGHPLPDGDQNEDEDDEDDDDVGFEDDCEPPVPVEGPDEAKVEAVVVSQLATDCSGLGRGSIEK